MRDLLFLGEAAGRTLLISIISITIGTLAGIVFGWLLQVGRIWSTLFLAPKLDIFRSVPMIIQLVLFLNSAPLIGLSLDAFASGLVVLSAYTASLVSNVLRGGIEAVEQPMCRAARSLGMTYWQDMAYVVWPIGMRVVFSCFGRGGSWCHERQCACLCAWLR